MANSILGQILGGAGRGGVRNAVLGGLLSRLARRGGAVGRMGGRGNLLLFLLPFALQWVQRNGGIGAVVDRFKQKGYQKHAASWVSTGDNAPLEATAVHNVVGREELTRIAKQLGVPEDEVTEGFAKILPEVTDEVSPKGSLAPEADASLDAGLSELEKTLREIQPDTHLQ